MRVQIVAFVVLNLILFEFAISSTYSENVGDDLTSLSDVDLSTVDRGNNAIALPQRSHLKHLNESREKDYVSDYFIPIAENVEASTVVSSDEHPFKPARSLLQISSSPSPSPVGGISIGSGPNHPSLIPLAVKRRPNPLNGFHVYTGGFNVTNKDYWASLVLTGVWAYAFVVLWGTFGCLLVIISIVKKGNAFQGRRGLVVPHHSSGFEVEGWERGDPNSRTGVSKDIGKHWRPRLNVDSIGNGIAVAILFAFSVLMVVWAVRLHNQVAEAANEVLFTSESVIQSANNVSQTLTDVATLLQTAPLLGQMEQGEMTALAAAVRSIPFYSPEAESTLRAGAQYVHSGNRIIESVTITIACVILFLLVIRLAAPDGVVLFLDWLLVLCCLFLAGLAIGLASVVSDTCTAMVEYQQHVGSTSWDASILPCRKLHPLEAQLGAGVSDVNELIARLNNYFRATQLPTPLPSRQRTPILCSLKSSSSTNFSQGGAHCLSLSQVANQTQVLQLLPSQGGQLVKAFAKVELILPQAESLANCSFVTIPMHTLMTRSCGPIMATISATSAFFIVVSLGGAWLCFASRVFWPSSMILGPSTFWASHM